MYFTRFPLIQLPRKSEEAEVGMQGAKFPLIQLPRKSEACFLIFLTFTAPVSINSTSEEVRSFSALAVVVCRSHWFPLIQLPRKSEVKPFRPLPPDW